MSAEKGPGPPGTLRKWLFGLRLPPGEHRILELLCEGADAEDGCSWPSIAWLARWAAMSERNVMRIVARLARPAPGRSEPLIRVWRVARRASTYQVLCPELPELENLARVARLRGVDLAGMGDRLSPDEMSPDNLSGQGDKSGPETAGMGDKSGAETVTDCHPELKGPEQDQNYELPKEPTSGATAPDGDARAGPIDWDLLIKSWNAAAREHGFTAIGHGLGEAMRRKLRTRFHDPGFTWRAILEAIPRARRVHGQKWFCVDWIARNDQNWRRLLDGQFDDLLEGAAPAARAPPLSKGAEAGRRLVRAAEALRERGMDAHRDRGAGAAAPVVRAPARGGGGAVVLGGGDPGAGGDAQPEPGVQPKR